MLIAITGAKESGKTTLGKYIEEEFGFVRIPMAEPLKSMLKAVGVSEEQLNGSQKEKPCDLLCNRTPREAMQTLGTEWGRVLIGQEIWTNLWANRVKQHINVVTDDIRYPNELTAAKTLGAITINIRRQGKEGQDSHSSELYANCMKTDIQLTNDGTIEELKYQFDTIMRPIFLEILTSRAAGQA